MFSFKAPDDTPTDRNTVVMKLNVRCDWKSDAVEEEGKEPHELYDHSTVYASDIQWEPKGDQAERFAHNPIKPALDNIIVAKLRPGQEINVELHCTKGTGKIHAKWSPVAPAYYRLLPQIDILKPIVGDAADRFAATFPKGIIGIKQGRKGKEAYVANARDYPMDREVLRHAEFNSHVRLGLVRDHFIFSIESTGALTPPELVLESIKLLKLKCEALKEALTNLPASSALNNA
jgi:DNA-directed RNA polymerase I and III subunit RPAC1